jgi:hypothetical protein
MKITNETTSEGRVIGFLDLTRDLNIVHREGGKLLPGMFYMALLAPYLSRPLKSLEVSFIDFRKYPLPLEVTLLDSTPTETKFSFSDKDGQVCKGEVGYSETAKADNSGLQEFADILGLPQDYTNLRALWLTCQTPGELVRTLQPHIPKYKKGYYAKQTFNFSDYLPADATLKLGTDSLKFPITKGRITTDYYSGNTKVAEGKALVFVG